jgi:putative salt-induced outer membrane protein
MRTLPRRSQEQLERGETMIRTLSALALLSAAAVAQAQTDPLVGAAALGYLATSGNTDSTNANASLKLDWTPDGLWSHQWTALAIHASTSGTTTAEAYAAGYKARRKINDKSYLFGAADWREDQFSAYDRQLTEAIGYGRKLIDNPRQTLAVEGGIGSKQSTLIDGTDQNEGVVRGALDYIVRINDTSTFTQKVLLEAGQDNRYTESVSALHVKMVKNIALVLSYTLKNNSDVPPGIEGTDTFTAISVEYAF